MPKIEDRYREALAHIPAPGGGGCHAALLGVASLAIMAGRSDAEAEAEIRAAIPPGGRRVADKEIRDAIRRAHKDTAKLDPNRPRQPRPIPPPRRTVAEIRAEAVKDEDTAAEIRRALREAGGGALDPFGADVWECSPIRLDAHSETYPHAADMIPLLRYLYRPADILFIGGQYEAKRDNLKTAAEWIKYFEERLAAITGQPPERQRSEFERLGAKYPYIMPNPHTGRTGQTKSGDKASWRADSCVNDFRYIVAEFDGMPFVEQGAMLRGLGKAGVKIAAVIYSGGKSCHAWICCEGVTTAEEWRTQVKDGLFPTLAALGVDKACSNPSRLSRLPGVFRADKGKWQQLLYLAPGGGMI